MEVDTETSTSVQELVSSLEQATLMASRIPTTADPYQLHQIRSTLLSAHRRLSLFQHHQPPPPENSGASAVGVAGDDNDVKMGDEEEEQNSRAVTTSTAAVDKVEERMRDCFIQNKRSKRALSPSMVVAAEQRRSWENDGFRDGAVAAEFDPYSAKCSSRRNSLLHYRKAAYIPDPSGPRASRESFVYGGLPPIDGCPETQNSTLV